MLFRSVLKGIQTAEDADLAVKHGVDVIYVSNHGGRQLDHGRAAIDLLPEVVSAARGKAELAKRLKITDQKVLDISYRDFNIQSPRNAEPSREGALRNIAMVAPQGATRNAEDYVDFSFAEELERAGFYAEMQKKYEIGRAHV